MENVFSPCLTSSSSKMSNVSYLALSSLRMPTKVRLKPHRGALGDPFIKTMIFDLLIKAIKRDSRLDPSESVLDVTETILEDASFTFLVNDVTSAPPTTSTICLFKNKIQVGASDTL